MLTYILFPEVYEAAEAIFSGRVSVEELSKGLRYPDGTYTIKGLIGLSAYQDIAINHVFSRFRKELVGGSLADFMTKQQYLESLNVLKIRL